VSHISDNSLYNAHAAARSGGSTSKYPLITLKALCARR
jgi:hypothetical protein